MEFAGRFTAQGALGITLCWIVALACAGSTDVLLFLAPALLIAIPLLSGLYIGEELIVKLAARRAPRPRSAAVPSAWSLPSAPEGRLPRGAGLIAFSLAKRPPPARLLTQN
jgi:hypothetical protein